jgi:hypothetical protein
VNGGASRQVKVEVNAEPGRNALTITTEGEAVSVSEAMPSGAADRKLVFGKLIDLRARVANPQIQLGVVQQRVE